MKVVIAFGVVAICLLLFLGFVWPTPYNYYVGQSAIIRINRINWKVERYDGSTPGWRQIDFSRKERPALSQKEKAEHIEKIHNVADNLAWARAAITSDTSSINTKRAACNYYRMHFGEETSNFDPYKFLCRDALSQNSENPLLKGLQRAPAAESGLKPWERDWGTANTTTHQ